METLKKAMTVTAVVAGIVLGTWFGLKEVYPRLNRNDAPSVNLPHVQKEIDISQLKKSVEFNPHRLVITEMKPLQIIEVNMEDLGEKQKCYLNDWISGNHCSNWIHAAVRQIEEKYKDRFEIKTEYSGGGMYDKHKAIMFFYPKQRKH